MAGIIKSAGKAWQLPGDHRDVGSPLSLAAHLTASWSDGLTPSIPLDRSWLRVGKRGLEPAVVWLIDRHLIDDRFAQRLREPGMVEGDRVVAQALHQRPA